MAILTFKNRATYEIAKGVKSKATLRILPAELHVKARVRLAMLDSVENLLSLRAMRSLNLEKLKGNKKEYWSIRINKQYRITFLWKGDSIFDVCIEDYH